MSTFDVSVRRLAPLGPVNLDASVVVVYLADGPLVCSRNAYIDLFVAPARTAPDRTAPTCLQSGTVRGAAEPRPFALGQTKREPAAPLPQ